MFQALKSIPKHDQRYLQLVRNHRYQQIGLSLLLAGSIALGGFGIHTMKLERVEKYNELVASQKNIVWIKTMINKLNCLKKLVIYYQDL
ncbi:hypothetical protein SD457_16090 [Coprobacillaceae bacterium CR2/5/TPMF4]|nr:hypothetical protein SD457_16090 [Coprobacillaceae bacterium CR2/5/TPMF4]